MYLFDNRMKKSINVLCLHLVTIEAHTLSLSLAEALATFHSSSIWWVSRLGGHPLFSENVCIISAMWMSYINIWHRMDGMYTPIKYRSCGFPRLAISYWITPLNTTNHSNQQYHKHGWVHVTSVYVHRCSRRLSICLLFFTFQKGVKRGQWRSYQFTMFTSTNIH